MPRPGRSSLRVMRRRNLRPGSYGQWLGNDQIAETMCGNRTDREKHARTAQKNGLPNLFDPDARRHSGGLRNRVRSGDRTNRNPPYASLYRQRGGGGRGAMASMFAVQVGKLLPAKSPGRKADRSLGWRAESAGGELLSRESDP